MAATKHQPALPLSLPEVPRRPVFAVWPPRVESPEALDLLAAELGRLKCLEERVRAETEERQGAIAREAGAALMIELEERHDPEPLTLADWRAQLEKAAEKFCTRHRETLLDEGKKSKVLVHGRFGWKEQKARLEALDDFPAGGNPKLLDAILKPLRAYVLKLADFFANAARFIDVKLAWRKAEMLKAWKDGELSSAELRKAGFSPCEPGEEFFIEPLLGDVESQSAEKPR